MKIVDVLFGNNYLVSSQCLFLHTYALKYKHSYLHHVFASI